MIIINSECLKECKKFLGVHPYNTDTNVCKKDGHFLYYLYNKYGKQVVEETLRYLRESE